eukprot:6064519-Alexandrium_andersonii.AAC.1
MCIRDRISKLQIVAHIASSRGARPPWTPRRAPPAFPPARFVVTIRFSAQNDADSPGRGLGG